MAITSQKYLVGNMILMTAAFTNAAGGAADPDTVTCTVKAPNGETIAATVVRDSTGLYHVDFSTTGLPAGKYVYRWAGVGTIEAAAEGGFTLTASTVA